MTSPNHESHILHPRPPTLLNSDDWPIFSLKNAHVFDPNQIDPTLLSPISLLHAGAYRPLHITGKLEAPPYESSHLLLKPSYHRSHSIELSDVRQFSYGQYEDGTVEIWAAGRAGWFTIVPARAYKDTYADMVMAVKLLYFASDKYKEVKKPTELHVRDLFHKYCLEHASLCKTIDDAEALFAKHRYFLFASMLDNKEGLQWAKIPLFKYFESTFPDDTALVRQRRAFAMKPPKAPASKRGSQSPAPSNASLKRKRKERGPTPAGAASTRSRTRSASVATTATSVNGTQDLPGSQPSATRSRSQRNSQNKPIVTASTPLKADSNADSEESDQDRQGHKGKSALRPKPAKYINGRQSSNTRLADGNDADDDETDEPHGPDQTSPTSKRKMLDDLKPRRAKRRHSEVPAREPQDQTLVDPDHDMEDPIDTPPETYHDANEFVPEEKRPTLPFRFRDGQDEGDVWCCDVDGCMHRVYAASESASKEFIEDHKRAHEFDDDQRVQLVRRMEAPWLPVGRLMDRVRELAAQNGTPAPIVQRY